MEGYVDLELQQYRLLAYLKEVQQYFSERKLYPPLGDVVFHYRNMLHFMKNKQLMQDQFPVRLKGVDSSALELTYERMLADDDVMRELEAIAAFAIEKMEGTLNEGAALYDMVERQVHLEPVGIIPLYKNEGYLMVRYGSYSEVRVYNYNITLFEHKDARYRGLKMTYVDSVEKTVVNTYEQIKLEIIRRMRVLPNPAVYMLESPVVIPLEETLLPVAKRLLARQLESI
jgi:hypothetical protein